MVEMTNFMLYILSTIFKSLYKGIYKAYLSLLMVSDTVMEKAWQEASHLLLSGAVGLLTASNSTKP